MLFRYGAAHNGSIEKKAHIYTQEEHGIDPRLVDPDAMWVIKRLRGARFHAYVVGGAVRDLLVGRTPKDFDVATDAHPLQIKRLFRSARVIGRRFRLVHVYCAREKYVEVSTFRSRVAAAVDAARSTERPDANNYYGTMEEDAQRRDFTINALYYCPIDHLLIDYVEALPDLRQRRLRTLVRAETSFEEDPVRMIRAVKYASLLGFPFPLSLAGLVRRMRESILSCSRERVTEEVFKILTSGSAAGIFELSDRLRLFEIMFPAHWKRLKESHRRLLDSPLGMRLKELDERTAAGDILDRGQMFGFLFSDLVREQKDIFEDPDPDVLIQKFIRSASDPLFPSKKDLATAARSILNEVRPHPRAAGGGLGAAGGLRVRIPHVPVHGPRAKSAKSASGGAAKRRRRRGRGRGRRGGAGKGPAV